MTKKISLARSWAISRFFASLDPKTDYLIARSPYCLSKEEYFGKIRFYKNRKRWLKTYKRWWN